MVILATVVAVAISLSLIKNRSSAGNLRADRAELEAQVQMLEETKARLDFENKLSEKKSSREKIVRNQKWRKKEGETILKLEDYEAWAEVQKEVAAIERREKELREVEVSESEKNWQAWVEIIKGV